MATKTTKRLTPEAHRGDPLYEWVLRFVNHWRVRRMRKPPLEQLPKGVPKRAGEDPVSRALGPGAVAGRDGYSRLPTPNGGLATYASSTDLGRFLDAFDNGSYPGLIKRS